MNEKEALVSFTKQREQLDAVKTTYAANIARNKELKSKHEDMGNQLVSNREFISSKVIVERQKKIHNLESSREEREMSKKFYQDSLVENENLQMVRDDEMILYASEIESLVEELEMKLKEYGKIEEKTAEEKAQKANEVVEILKNRKVEVQAKIFETNRDDGMSQFKEIEKDKFVQFITKRKPDKWSMAAYLERLICKCTKNEFLKEILKMVPENE